MRCFDPKELKVIPAQVKVVEHIRYVYSCRECEKQNITTPIITASMPNPVLKGSFVSPSLMAYIMDRKYSEAVPLYRQEKQFNNFGIDLSRQNLANWVIHTNIMSSSFIGGDVLTLTVIVGQFVMKHRKKVYRFVHYALVLLKQISLLEKEQKHHEVR